MGRRSITVGELAAESELEVETVLVALWGVGIEHVDSPSSRLSDTERRIAQRAVGVAGERQRKVSYWTEWLGVTRGEFADLLEAVGIQLSPRATTVPKGAIKRLRNLPPREVPVEAREAEPTLQSTAIPAPAFPDSGNGHSLRFLTADEVLQIHEALEEDFFTTDDPISPPGVRDRNLLEGAVERHMTRFGDRWKYPTVELAGAALLHGLVHNHPFHNGNKRTALVSLLVFLDRNGRVMQQSPDDLFKWMVRVAAHELLNASRIYVAPADHEVLAIGNWIAAATRQVRKDERAVPWRVMRKILRDYGCSVNEGKGDKVRIERTIRVKSKRGIFKTTKNETLVSFHINTGDAREVPKTQIKKIRQDLHLDEEHGVDSEMFYVEQRRPDEFILEYSKILRRLAKV